MFALISTMNAIQGDSIGTILSTHRTIQAAEAASEKINKATKRANGANGYLPTRVVKLTKRPAGRYIANDEWTA